MGAIVCSSAIHFDVVFAVSIPFTRLQLAPPELKLPTSTDYRPRINHHK
jgi:hypothetical protein